MPYNTINNEFFKKIGELLGHLQFRSEPEQIITVYYLEKQGIVYYTRINGEEKQRHGIAAIELAAYKVDLTVIAECIIEKWNDDMEKWNDAVTQPEKD